MTSRELTTISAFYRQNFARLLPIFREWNSDMAKNINRQGIKDLTHNWYDKIVTIENLLRGLGNDGYEDILTHFNEIPIHFYRDLLIANTILSEELKANICDAHFEQIQEGIRYELTPKISPDYCDLIVEYHYHMVYPQFFERSFENFLRSTVTVNPHYYLRDFLLENGEDFYGRTIDIWLNPDLSDTAYSENFFSFCELMSWDFIERHLIPLALANDDLMWDILTEGQPRNIIPEAFLDRLIERDVKFSFAYTWFKKLTTERWSLIREKIFDRLETDPEFVARFTYSDAMGHDFQDYSATPIFREVFKNTASISRADIIKASFLWQMSTTLELQITNKTKSLTPARYLDFVAENYSLLLKLFEDTRVEYRFLSYGYPGRFYLSLGREFSPKWWMNMAARGTDMSIWRHPASLSRLRISPEMRTMLLMNENITLDIVNALDPLSDEEFVLLMRNPLPIQKALEAEMNIANQAESTVYAHFYIEGTPQQRVLAALRESRSLYPR